MHGPDDPEAARWALALAEAVIDHLHDLMAREILGREHRISRLRQELHEARNQVPTAMRLRGETEPGEGSV